MFPVVLLSVYTAGALATVAVARGWPIEFSVARLLLGGVSALVCGLLAFGFSLHACGAGVPVFTWLLPSLLLAVTVARVRARPAALLGVVHVVCAMVLSILWAAEVHGPAWVGRDGRLPGERVIGEREWHTFATGLYRRAPFEGPVDMVIETVERPRPE
jgi:hypothetical protein